MYEEFPGSYKDQQTAIQYAKMLNSDHSNDCCEVKWMVEKVDKEWKIVRYNYDNVPYRP